MKIISSLTKRQHQLVFTVVFAICVYLSIVPSRIKRKLVNEITPIVSTYSNSEWPHIDLHQVVDKCQVKFRNENMRLCHFIPYNGNFGDELGPAVILKHLQNHMGCNVDNLPILNIAKKKRLPNEICLFSLGSIFHMIQKGDHVWGTGINPTWTSLKEDETKKNITFYAVRGPKTEALVKKHFKLEREIGKGDPGFLVPFVYPEYRIPEKIDLATATSEINTDQLLSQSRLCFIPHFHDMNYKELKQLPSKNVISVVNSWRNVVDNMKNCSFVVSSSLHGLVVADAMGIPSRWFQFPDSKTSRTEGLFKYRDYYATINRFNMTPLRNFTEIFRLKIQQHPPISLSHRKSIFEKTVASFPYHIFHKVNY